MTIAIYRPQDVAMRLVTIIPFLLIFGLAGHGRPAIAQDHPPMMDSGMGSGMMGRGMMGRPVPQQTTPGASGAEIFQNKCAMCHVLRSGAPSTVGPNLHGVFGRKSGSLADYPYSAALRNAGILWNQETLEQFIAAPQRFVRGTTMEFPGIPDQMARQKLIVYLKTATK